MSHKIPEQYAGNAVFRSVIEHLERKRIRFAIDAEAPYVRFGIMDGKCGTLHCVGSVDKDGNCFVFRVRLPMAVPEDKRALMSEALVCATCGMKVGCFEMDLQDGEVSFRTYAVCKGAPMEDAVVAHNVQCALAMCRMYYPAFISVIHGNASPRAAIEAAEVDDDTPATESAHGGGGGPGGGTTRAAASARQLARNMAAEFMGHPEEEEADDDGAHDAE